MRVLHVIPSVSSYHGGPTKALETMEQALSAAGVDVFTATTDDAAPGHRLPAETRPSRANGATRTYHRKWSEFYKVAPAMVPWLWRNVRGFDVVHIHALFSFASTVAAHIAGWRGVPYIVRPLGTLTVYGVKRRRALLKRISLSLLEGRILRRAAAVHFTTQAEWDEAKLLGIPFSGVVIPLAVAPGLSTDSQCLLDDQPQLRDRHVVLYLSRLDRKKNIEGLLEAFASLAKRRSDVALVVAGGGQADYAASLQALAETLGVADRVVFLGHVEGETKAAVFRLAEVFVLPSYSENFGIAAVEALQAGLPCILSDGVAVAQEIQDAGAGIVVSTKPDDIARAIEQFLADESLRREAGRRGRLMAEEHYSIDAMTRKLRLLYQRVMAADSPVNV